MGVEIDADLYAAVQTLGADVVMELARGLVRARKIHPVYAVDETQGAAVVMSEAKELEVAAMCEPPVRQHAEALDVAVTAVRYMRREWMPEFRAEEPAQTSEETFRPKQQVWGEDLSTGLSELCEHVCWMEGDDPVNHPSHYTAYPVEVIDMIRLILGDDGFRAYCLGNEVKYRMRAGLKGDAAEDISKAMKYKEFRDGAV